MTASPFEDLAPVSEVEAAMLADLSVPEEIVSVDEDTMALINTQTGEVIGYQEIPSEELEGIRLAEWVGERRVWHKAKAEGLEAEKQLWIDTINKRFDTRIKRHKGAMVWFEQTYYGFLFELAKHLIGDGKKRSAAVGLLLLKLRKTSAKTEVLDAEKAIAYMENAAKEHPEQCADLLNAIKVSKSILVSQLPDEFKAKLIKESNQAKVGIAFHPGGEIELKLE